MQTKPKNANLTNEQKEEILKRYKLTGKYKQTSRDMGVPYTTVWNVVNPAKAKKYRNDFLELRGNISKRGAAAKHLQEIKDRYFSK